MRKVIVNSTPLIILCGIGKLNILKEVYEEIIIPSAVYITARRKCIRQNFTMEKLGLSVTGTLGVLVKAKRQGIIKEVRPLLSEMRQNGFYVSNAVEEMVLEQAGE